MISEFTKLRALICAVHLAGAIGVYWYWNPYWLLLSGASVFAFLWLGQELYCHRYLSHSSFNMAPLLQKVCAWLSIYNLFGNPIAIAATHVNHHKYSDTERDPHPASHPVQSWLWIYPEFATSRSMGTVRKLMQDRLLVIISRNYFKIYIGTMLILAAIDLRIVIYGMFVPVIYAVFCDGVVNVICHIWGYRRHDTGDHSRNNLIGNALLLFSGIAMHNNHHAQPKNYRMSQAWYEIDLVGLIAHQLHIQCKTEMESNRA